MDWATPYTDYIQGQRDWLQTAGDVRRQRAMDLEYVMSAMEPSIMATRDQRLFSNQLDQLRMQDQMARQRANEQAQLALKQMGLRYILEGAQRGSITGQGVADALGATGVLPGQLYFMDPVTGQPRAYGGSTNGAPVPQQRDYSMGTLTPDNGLGGTVAPPGYQIAPVPVPAPAPAPAPAPTVPAPLAAPRDPALRYVPRPRSARGTPDPNAPTLTEAIIDALGGASGTPNAYHTPSDRPVQPPMQPRRRNLGATASPAQTLFGE